MLNPFFSFFPLFFLPSDHIFHDPSKNLYVRKQNQMLIFVKGKVGTKILLWMTDSKTRKEVTGPRTFCLVSLVQKLQLFSKCVQVQAEENGQCGTPPKGWSFKRGGNGCTMSWPSPYPHQPRYGNPTHCTRDLHNHMSTHIGKQPGFPYPVTKRLYHLRDFLRIPIQWLM